ncbi:MULTISPECIES: ATPase [Halorussus]|uniref:ATPase n=1 Tax=Halorussus TaxID=1070314 RepID=UPI0020A1B6BF|nr:ATPase [Halorussus vallis]USZ75969.1 ATPase [Halorussus vallis]
MTLLVAGGDRVDAGKTTFTTGLLARLGGVGFKPRAGNDYWFDHDDYRRAVDAGRLYGKDAMRLAAASAGDLSPEEINSVHRLWRPSPGPDAGLVGQSRREFVCDRVGEAFVVNARADVPASARENLPLDDADRVRTVDELDEATRRLHLPAFERLGERIEAADAAVVESYGDVAVPIRGVEFDAVAVVEPGRMRVYRGDRYLKARSVASGSARDGRLEERVADVVELLDPEATAALPALGSAARTDPDAVAEAYADAYDALLDVA